MTIQEHIESLSIDKQFKLAIRLLNLAVPIWHNYAENGNLHYRDSVVGLQHSVDKNLLTNTLRLVGKYCSANLNQKLLAKDDELLGLKMLFSDPIIALQDDDWNLPKDVENVFYGIYNILNAALGEEVTMFGESTIYISINQALTALDFSGQIATEELKAMMYLDSD